MSQRKYKALRFRSKEERESLGEYAWLLSNDMFGGSNTPQLMEMTATKGNLKTAYPKHNFDEVELVVVSLEILHGEDDGLNGQLNINFEDDKV